ncbi:MAG: hemerythrin domain-containing protein [Silicimonas sp.]|nr:hemerythrin domain-containing protein [Silicimonas sp.]
MKHSEYETTQWALENRQVLPDALRVLLQDYPRELWEDDPGFSQLIRFWLDRHLMFRRIMEALLETTAHVRDKSLDPQSFAHQLSRYGSMFVGELHAHHSVEDAHYFPVMKTLDSRITAGFDILDKDHHTIDARLQGFAEMANGVLRGMQADEAAAMAQLGPLADELKVLEHFLDRHLTDEEELVVPVLLKYTPEGLV